MNENKAFEEMLKIFGDGNGFGDPDGRRNAELRLQILLAKQQAKTAERLNLLTFLLVCVGLLNAVVFAVQIWKN